MNLLTNLSSILVLLIVSGCNQSLKIEVQQIGLSGGQTTLAQHRMDYLRDTMLPAVLDVSQGLLEYQQLLKQTTGKLPNQQEKQNGMKGNEPELIRAHMERLEQIMHRREHGLCLVQNIHAYLSGAPLPCHYRGFVSDFKFQPGRVYRMNELGTIEELTMTPSGPTKGKVLPHSVTATTVWITTSRNFIRTASEELERFADMDVQNASPLFQTAVSNAGRASQAINQTGLAVSVPPQVGFGGFLSKDVHLISPSDPNYGQVLRARPIGNPITSTFSQVSGDSTLIFVQESPTQMRFFSIEMDADQLNRNILMVTDKALEAAVKYASPLP